MTSTKYATQPPVDLMDCTNKSSIADEITWQLECLFGLACA